MSDQIDAILDAFRQLGTYTPQLVDFHSSAAMTLIGEELPEGWYRLWSSKGQYELAKIEIDV